LAKINVEEGAEIAERFEINAVPTIMLVSYIFRK
jgi:thioredoxin-like negative regulator of GroEL